MIAVVILVQAPLSLRCGFMPALGLIGQQASIWTVVLSLLAHTFVKVVPELSRGKIDLSCPTLDIPSCPSCPSCPSIDFPSYFEHSSPKEVVCYQAPCSTTETEPVAPGVVGPLAVSRTACFIGRGFEALLKFICARRRANGAAPWQRRGGGVLA